MRHILSAAAALLLASAGAASAGSIFQNGDFSAGNAGVISNFGYSPGDTSSAGTYDVTSDPSLSNPGWLSFGDHTTGNGQMLVANGTGRVWSQTVAVNPNTLYYATFNYAGLTEQAAASLSWSVSAGGVSQGSNTTAPVDGWRTHIAPWYSGNQTQATFELWSTWPGRNPYFALDDISLGVPEPTTWAMMIIGFGFIGAGLRRAKLQPGAV